VVVAIARFRKHFPQRPAPLAGREREREMEMMMMMMRY
jgi:hypothetical protein